MVFTLTSMCTRASSTSRVWSLVFTKQLWYAVWQMWQLQVLKL